MARKAGYPVQEEPRFQRGETPVSGTLPAFGGQGQVGWLHDVGD